MNVLVSLMIGLALILGVMAVSSTVKRYREQFTQTSQATLADMFLFVDPQKLFYFNAIGIVLVPLLVFLGTGSGLLTTLSAVVVLVAPRMAYTWMGKRRRARFAVQLPDALTMIANALRAGASLQMSLDVVVRESAPPLSQELGLVVREQRLGVALEDALDGMARRVTSQDFDLVVSAIVIAKEVGGNLSETLERLASTLRAKAIMEGKIDALTSQGKMQGIVVGLLPVFLAGILTFMDPVAMAPLYNTYWGWAAMGAVLVLELIGAFFIRKIVNIDV
ncbi:type II secretion system F family protein [Ralstonia pseudosolanacearum]|uniref:type II secretion system F family protein n=1 Tax=Ralstonia pseudosolanacearum TaxID=1310165 RepID=UPI001FFA9CEE|nr:type II secretion system F family protein [Ralstonia pseudosolanacearum]